MIELKNVYKTYNLGKSNAFEALKDISLTIEDGEMVAVTGKSGAGKSTLMHIIGCIDDFEKGVYLLNGEDISHTNDKRRAEIRCRDIGIVMQDFALVEEYSAIENVMIPMYFDRTRHDVKRKQRAVGALEQLGIAELMDKKVSKLSVGQKQRVAIARALVNNPSIIIADEPTGALDVKTSGEIMDIFRKLNDSGITIIIVTHDPEVASACRRIIEIGDGRIIN